MAQLSTLGVIRVSDLSHEAISKRTHRSIDMGSDIIIARVVIATLRKRDDSRSFHDHISHAVTQSVIRIIVCTVSSCVGVRCIVI